jgi:capsular exopolysaccharide synthesis family protein
LPGDEEKAARSAVAKRAQDKGLMLRPREASPKQQAVALLDPRSIPAEQYGFLAMQVRQVMGGPGSHVVAVTSSAGGEGKTITSINLAATLARTRMERVLLLECDLRKPQIHDYLGVRPFRGLAELLLKPEDPLEPYFHRINQLTVLLGGSLVGNPLELLSSDRLRAVLNRLRQEFQYIVVDLPPILPIADSRIVADSSDGVILVVRAQRTRRELFQHALERFNAPNILGVVLNGVDPQRSPYAHAYDYYEKEYLGQRSKKAS